MWIKYDNPGMGVRRLSAGIYDNSCDYPASIKRHQFYYDNPMLERELYDLIVENRPEDTEVYRVDIKLEDWSNHTNLSVMVRSSCEWENEDFAKIGEKLDAHLTEILGKHVEEEKQRVDYGAEKGFTVYAGKIPLTTKIADSNRAATAYNMMMALAAGKTDVTAPMCSMDGKEISLTAEILRVEDENGTSFRPLIDKEWFGTEKENDAIKEEVFQKYKQEFIAEEGEEAWGEDVEREIQDQYQVVGYDEDNCSVRFMPLTWDLDKTQEMYNCLTYGMNPDVTISVCNNFEDCVEIDPTHLCVVNSDGDVLKEEADKNWARDLVDEDAAFEDAVNALDADDSMKL